MPIDTDTVTYTFDEQNRLRSYANERTGDEGSYTYYGNGLRATKAENGNQTKYVYMNGNVIEELDNAGNVKARNIWGNELLFRKDVGANKQGYYLYNSHGDVVSITDSSGAELNRYDYDSWGNLVAQTETMSNPFKYSGEIFDEKTGYYYLRARYYDPKIGRFISEDTYKGQVDNPLSLNRYTYVHNNPLRFVDPTGHWCESADGKWAHAGSCNDRSNMSRYEPDYKHDNDFIVENGVIKGVYEHVEGAREDIALEVNTFMLFAPIPKFLWGAKAAGAGKTAVTVWDTIKVTQAAVKGTNIPKSFVLSGLKAGGHEIWVHPIATKHMIDYMLKNERVINLSTQSKQMIEQAMLTSFRSAVEKAMPNLKPGRNFMTVGQWEIGINITEAEAVIYHALFR
ncbi:RHS repeat-associated core domain-containing protein [Brevibacillus sedimenti]|uniref:RHS repeat-associated core domain-containing protein n=1 Tax=Brevibacillus sedimenti TaxID=2613334 RepID=UPI001E52A37C|nr:RHS repeat-associated core domain-containing protein [Anoxybacillus sediminis]